ncbi:hypothetical protein ARSEF1564_009309 [Beauveria bassiana]
MMHSLSRVVVARALMILGSFGDATLVIGMVCTQANDNLGTDSDASTTALPVVIAVNEADQPVASVPEAAHYGGFETCQIATSRITHATPA